MLKEVIEEIRGSRGQVQVSDKPNEEKNTHKKKAMSKEEIEAYRARKMREEEARVLKANGMDNVRARKCRNKDKSKKGPKTCEDKKTRRTPKQAHMLQPLQPLYLLKIPGLPKGDCIAICLAHGADTCS